MGPDVLKNDVQLTWLPRSLRVPFPPRRHYSHLPEARLERPGTRTRRQVGPDPDLGQRLGLLRIRLSRRLDGDAGRRGVQLQLHWGTNSQVHEMCGAHVLHTCGSPAHPGGGGSLNEPGVNQRLQIESRAGKTG